MRVQLHIMQWKKKKKMRGKMFPFLLRRVEYIKIIYKQLGFFAAVFFVRYSNEKSLFLITTTDQTN